MCVVAPLIIDDNIADMEYYIIINGSEIGPMTAAQLMNYNVTDDTQVRRDDTGWAPLYAYPELMAIYREYGRRTWVDMQNDKLEQKKLLCGIFAIVIGWLGIQYFIVGKTGGGLLTILLSVVTCGLWEIVTLIQGIMILVMSPEEFRRKYVDSTATLPLF